MYRLTSKLCLLAGVGLLLAAAYLYWADSLVPRLDVSQAHIELTNCAAGEESTFAYELHNRGSAPMRVLGLTGC